MKIENFEIDKINSIFDSIETIKITFDYTFEMLQSFKDTFETLTTNTNLLTKDNIENVNWSYKVLIETYNNNETIKTIDNINKDIFEKYVFLNDVSNKLKQNLINN